MAHGVKCQNNETRLIVKEWRCLICDVARIDYTICTRRPYDPSISKINHHKKSSKDKPNANRLPITNEWKNDHLTIAHRPPATILHRSFMLDTTQNTAAPLTENQLSHKEIASWTLWLCPSNVFGWRLLIYSSNQHKPLLHLNKLAPWPSLSLVSRQRVRGKSLSFGLNECSTHSILSSTSYIFRPGLLILTI